MKYNKKRNYRDFNRTKEHPIDLLDINNKKEKGIERIKNIFKNFLKKK